MLIQSRYEILSSFSRMSRQQIYMVCTLIIGNVERNFKDEGCVNVWDFCINEYFYRCSTKANEMKIDEAIIK